MWIRTLLTTVLVASSAYFAACGDSATKPEGPAPLKVGLLVTDSTADGGWNQLAYDSLKKLEPIEGIETAVLQQVSKDKAADAIRQFDAKGCTLVIAHGFEYQSVVQEMTGAPGGSSLKTKLVVSGGDANDPHFASLAYDLAGASYQLGIIAGRVTKTNKLGFVAGDKIPPVLAMQRGFEAGAKSVNPKITLAVQYTGWSDPGKAKKQVEAFIADGVDIVMQNVDAASSGVFEAVKEQNAKPMDALRPSVYTFGANSDQNANPICPDYTLASATINLEKAFGQVINKIKADKFTGGLVPENVANGVAVAVLNPKLVGKVIDVDTQKLVDAAAVKLTSGDIKIPDQ